MSEGAPDKAFVLDPQNNQVIAEVELGTDLHVAHIVLDPESTRAYVMANEASLVVEIDALEHTVLRSIDLGADKGPHGARYCRDKLYVANMTGKSLGIVHPDMEMVEDVPLGGVAVQTACTPDGRFVFVSLYDTKEVVRYEIATGALTRIALPPESQGPVQLYPSPDSKLVWVCDQGILDGRPASNELFRIAVDAATVTGTVRVGQGAHGVVVSDDGALAYVTNVADATVSVVDTAALSTIATIPVGDKPNGISHWHGSGGMP
jgi:YVTN family beta-propeller protein